MSLDKKKFCFWENVCWSSCIDKLYLDINMILTFLSFLQFIIDIQYYWHCLQHRVMQRASVKFCQLCYHWLYLPQMSSHLKLPVIIVLRRVDPGHLALLAPTKSSWPSHILFIFPDVEKGKVKPSPFLLRYLKYISVMVSFLI